MLLSVNEIVNKDKQFVCELLLYLNTLDIPRTVIKIKTQQERKQKKGQETKKYCRNRGLHTRLSIRKNLSCSCSSFIKMNEGNREITYTIK